VIERDRYEEQRVLLLLHGLVRRREALRARGAGADELRANQLDIERARWRLAGAVRRRVAGSDPQAA
jgi:hypothetical protein